MKFKKIYQEMPFEAYEKEFQTALKALAGDNYLTRTDDVKKFQERGISPQKAAEQVNDRINKSEFKRIITLAKKDLEINGRVSFEAKMEELKITAHLPSKILTREEIISAFQQVLNSIKEPEIGGASIHNQNYLNNSFKVLN